MAKTLGTPWQKLGHEVPASELEGVDLYWRASNYLSVGQIYLRSNPLMRPDFVDEKTGEVRDFGRPDVKHRLVGHWGTTPGINFLFGHVNRLIADHNQNAIFLMGPGHGGPAGTAQSLLDGTYREVRPDITDDELALLAALKDGERTADQLVDQTQIPAKRVLSALTMLQIQAAVAEHPGRRFSALVELEE